MQQLTCKMVWSFSFFILFKKALILRESWGKILKKCVEKYRKSVEKVPKRFCPLVVALLLSLIFEALWSSKLLPNHFEKVRCNEHNVM